MQKWLENEQAANLEDLVYGSMYHKSQYEHHNAPEGVDPNATMDFHDRVKEAFNMASPALIAGAPQLNVTKVAVATSETAESAVQYSQHALQRMTERGITRDMVEATLRKGTKYFDPKNNTYNYVLEGGFASGKDILVGTNSAGQVTTVIRGSKLVSSRFIRQ